MIAMVHEHRHRHRHRHKLYKIFIKCNINFSYINIKCLLYKICSKVGLNIDELS